MACKRSLGDEEIAALLENVLDDSVSSEIVSEIEDEVMEDDVQSDIEDESIQIDEANENSQPTQATTTFNQISETDEISESIQASTSLERIIQFPQTTLRSKNRHLWSTSKGQNTGRTSAINIVRTARGPTRKCKSLYDPVLCFDMYFTEEIISEIVKWTNVEIFINRRNDQRSATFRDTNLCEIRALTGILTLTAALKDNHLSTDELFNTSYCGTRYTATMSRERFDFLIRHIRMDDKALRPALRPNDAFIPVRKIWDLFIKQCKENYIPGSHTTIDEQLLGFRGRCPFKIYIPNKPEKYGIKIPMICDSTTRYMLNAMPYLGKSTNTSGIPLGEYYVKELSRPIHGTCRNITCDNWFTSVPLAKSLLKQPYNLTLVGTIRSNKREIPEEIKNSRARRVGTSSFCYDGPFTLVSYKPKPSKMVYLLSSCNEKGTIDEKTGKPDIFYIITKQKVESIHSTKRVHRCHVQGKPADGQWQYFMEC